MVNGALADNLFEIKTKVTGEEKPGGEHSMNYERCFLTLTIFRTMGN
jgi:hypothetical protein